MTDNQNQPLHVPVLLAEVLDVLQPSAGDSYLDATAGYGGHAAEVLKRTQAPDKAVLVDRDENAINELTARFAGNPVRLMHTDFLSSAQTLSEQGETFDLILADLGVSSPHLNQQQRGFALSLQGPLDMRMDPRQPVTAATILNTYSHDALANIISQYGEEPKAKAIAKLIVDHRPLTTTTELAELCKRVWPGHSRVHPATRTFQALRIAVNDELGLLTKTLPLWESLLAPGGRLAIISFHSLEDRLVKQYFTEQGGERFDATLKILTKRPLSASTIESVSNPRARSAKLRAAAKIKK